jgi:ribulose-5-phosphate 4-epimerase/fuculose-1-phosphate aldolase
LTFSPTFFLPLFRLSFLSHRTPALTGKTWEQAKTQAECADYLFEMAVKMIQAGIPLVGEDKTPSKPFI